MLRLEKIDPGNVRAVCELKLKKAQKHLVAANYISIIQTYAAIGTGCTTFPFAVCCDGKPVGFIIIGYNLASLYDYENYYDWEAPGIYHNNYNLWRLVIDKRYQNKGYGRAAIKLALDFIRTWPAGKA